MGINVAICVVFAESLFYGVLAPLLADLQDSLGFNDFQAGGLVAAYFVGNVVGALGCTLLIDSRPRKPAALLGMGLICLATFGFAEGSSLAVLATTRFLQGTGGSIAWIAVGSWASETAPASKRGQVVSLLLAAGFFGAAAGPALGAVAADISRSTAFTVFGVVMLAITAWVAAALPGGESAAAEPGVLDGAQRGRRSGAATFLVAGLMGAVSVAIPLRVHSLGGGANAVGTVLVIGTLLRAVGARTVGRQVDRGKSNAVFAITGIASAVSLALMAASPFLWTFLILAVAGWTVLGLQITAVATTGSIHGERHGKAWSALTLLWSGGFGVGAAGGGAGLDTAGHTALFATLAAGALLASLLGRRPDRVAGCESPGV